MMAVTHAVITAAGVSFALADTSPLVIGLAVAGSQLPDLDTSSSLVGQVFFPISRWLEERYPHRSVTHSFLATGAVALLSLPLYFYLGWKAWIALWLGHTIACFSDTFTKQGVQLFWPSPVWAVCGSNPHRRLRTGSPAEYWVLVGATALLVTSIFLQSTGGLVQSASVHLGLRSGAIAAYNQYAGTHHIWANIEGVKEGDRSTVSGRFFILGTEGDEFVVTDGQSIYKTGEQIIASRLTAKIGDTARTEIVTLAFEGKDTVAALKRLGDNYPNSVILLSGVVEVDFPDEIESEVNPEQFQTIVVSGTRVKIRYSPQAFVVAGLSNQYATGSLSAKIITPIPRF